MRSPCLAKPRSPGPPRLAQKALEALFFNDLREVHPPPSAVVRDRPVRRSAFVLSVGSVVLGLELATDAVSTAFAGLAIGVAALAGIAEYPVPLPRFLVGVALVVGGAGLGATALWAQQQQRRVEAVGRTCPRCGEPTRRIRKTSGQKLLVLASGRSLTHRTCGKCGWTGLAAAW